MSWSGKRIVPTDWKSRKATVLRRDAGICHVCRQPGAAEVDHILPVAEGGSHHLDNLAAIHADPCHRHKTRTEIARGQARRPKARRDPELHPGLLP